ncbi:hypothetical protein [Williamsia muralis]|uniref:DUF1003 domain-containing protein n=1 Tax=Williamsia marianensis TaxID=85044 RepID=A0ABU4EVW4_WILMA|nr:hypothetical protein [Williamsia muralis]MDV7135382.1 hypothetical protein [Williamsia muralis]
MARKTKGKTKRQRAVSEAELDAAVAKNAQWASVIKTAIYAICVPISILALMPVTELVAGEETIVDVNVVLTFSLSVTFAITTTGFASWGVQRNRAAKQARKEVTSLRKKLTTAEASLQASEQRVGELEGDLGGVRDDLERLRQA